MFVDKENDARAQFHSPSADAPFHTCILAFHCDKVSVNHFLFSFQYLILFGFCLIHFVNHNLIITFVSVFVNRFLQICSKILIFVNQRYIIVMKGCDIVEIGEKIKQRRNELEWSQRELARRMGYTNNSTIAKIEQGKVDVSQARVVQFSKVLGVSIAWLMDWEETEKKNDQLVVLVTRLRKDDKFMKAVQMLDTLTPQQFEAVMQMLSAFNLK